MSTTRKSTRGPQDSKRAACVKAVAKEFDVTESHVYTAINTNSDMGRYAEIRRSYNIRYAALAEAIAKALA